MLFRLRRPAYLISSTMFVEDGEGSPLGEIHQRWHLMRRNYDLYLDKAQFAAISGGGHRGRVGSGHDGDMMVVVVSSIQDSLGLRPPSQRHHGLSFLGL